MKRVFPLLLAAGAGWAQDPALLQIKIVEGEGAIYATGSRATRGITVQVTDETGKPVEAASVSFRLPDDGATGTFSNGSRTEIAVTGADGRAGVWGMQWNRTAGSMEVRVTAMKRTARAGTVCAMYLSDSPMAKHSNARMGPRGHKWLWIGLAAGAAAAAGIAGAGLAARAGSSTASSAASVVIGTPTIIIGSPSGTPGIRWGRP